MFYQSFRHSCCKPLLSIYFIHSAELMPRRAKPYIFCFSYPRFLCRTQSKWYSFYRNGFHGFCCACLRCRKINKEAACSLDSKSLQVIDYFNVMRICKRAYLFSFNFNNLAFNSKYWLIRSLWEAIHREWNIGFNFYK